MDWYIAVNNQAKTMPEDVLIYKIKNKEISGETLVVNSDIKNWIPLKKTDIWTSTKNSITNNNFPNTDTKQQKNVNDVSPHSTNEQKTKSNAKAINAFIKSEKFVAIVLTIIPVLMINFYMHPSYYVAKMPNFSAGTVKVDGYMHKSKTCCQAVANRFGAEVIKVKPKQVAGTNEYGQTLDYEDAFNYCPICCY